MNLSKFFVKKSLFGPKIFKVQNNFGLNRILGQKNFRSSKIVDPIIFSCKKKDPKKFKAQQKIKSKKHWDQKFICPKKVQNVWVKHYCGPKKFGSRKFTALKNWVQ